MSNSWFSTSASVFTAEQTYPGEHLEKLLFCLFFENEDPGVGEAVLNLLEQGKRYLKARILTSLCGSSSLPSCHSCMRKGRVSSIGSGLGLRQQINRLFQLRELFLICVTINLYEQGLIDCPFATCLPAQE